MKVRKDFVTNSSSSSFVINRDKISYEELKKILVEIAILSSNIGKMKKLSIKIIRK